MKLGLFSLIGLILISRVTLAEGVPSNDQEFMRYMQMKADQAQMEDELKNPKNPDMGKDRAVLGNRTAPIKLFVYSDFQCPYCKRGYETVEELRKQYGNKIVVMFKHLPLPFHPMALPAAKRFEAIALESSKKAYQFHNELFSNQQGLSGGEEFLDGLVKKVGADLAKVKKNIDSPVVKNHIEADKAEAQKYGIQGTPGFVIAGVTVKGAYPIDTFVKIINERLGSSIKGK